jgi:hypothetical protein
MAGSETLVFRASLTPRVNLTLRDRGHEQLHILAHAIVECFDFNFDHAFGFYSSLKGNIYDSPVKYELFVNVGETEGDARSVERTRVVEAFPSAGSKMRFLLPPRRMDLRRRARRAQAEAAEGQASPLVGVGRKGTCAVWGPGGRLTAPTDPQEPVAPIAFNRWY